MVFLAVFAFAGVHAYMDGMKESGNIYYENQNLQDLWITSRNFTSEDLEKINHELEAYSAKLARRKQLVVANKMDLPDSADNFVILKEYVEEKGYEIMPVSAATGDGLQELMWKAYEMAGQYVAEPEEEIGVIEEGDPDSFEIIRGAEDADFEVKGKNIERLVAMTNFDNEEALYRFQLIWKRLKIEEALLEAGIQEGQTVRILDMVFNYQKSKWADRK